MGITRPTRNPFEKPKKQATLNYKEPPKPLTDEEQARNFVPSRKYFVSDEMKGYVAYCVVNNELTVAELPFIYELAALIALVQHWGAPTITDLEAAVKIRTLERLKNIAAGTEKQKPLERVMDGKPLPKPIFDDRWKKLANAALAAYQEKHKCDPVQ